MNFTFEQEEAIKSSLYNNTYIAAAPGSGKSTILSEITKRILEKENANIMLLTFTNKSAKDIINKVNNKITDNVNNKIIGGTFHSISYKIMRDVDYYPDICDENKKRLIIKNLFNCKKDKDLFNHIYSEISVAKSYNTVDKNGYIDIYNKELAKYNMVDFDDLIIKGIDYIDKLKTSIQYVLIDELQDTSKSQLDWLIKIYEMFEPMMIGVGDSDQALYSFRGADVKNVNKFIEKFNCKIKTMATNFRSDKIIVKKSKNLIQNNKERIHKNFIAHSNNNGFFNINQFQNIDSELKYITMLCKKHINENMSIIYRDRLNKNKLEFELKKNNINYTVNDSTEITDRSPFRVIMAMLKISSGNYDTYDLTEATKGIKKLGLSTVEKIKNIEIPKGYTLDLVLKEQAEDNKKMSNSLSTIWKLQDEFEKYKNSKLNMLVGKFPSYLIKSFNMPKNIFSFFVDISKNYNTNSSGIKDLANDFGLNTKEEKNNIETNIELSTIHGIKGGENDIIIMPFSNWKFKNEITNKYIEEERRVFYVGMTRAKHYLYLTYNIENGSTKFIHEVKK